MLIIDTPAVSESAEVFSLLGRRVYLLLVARPKHTYRNSLKLVVGQMRYQSCAGTGLVFFDVDEPEIIAALSSEAASEEDLRELEEIPAESSHW